MLVTGKKILQKANKENYAVPALNINNMEILQAVVESAVEMKSPVIVQTSEGAIQYAGMDYLVAMTQVAARSKVPIALHLDHGKDLKIIKQAINSGYTSVMIDASLLPYKENVKISKMVVGWARKKGISVEAELGAIKGVEDLVSVLEREAFLTDPEQAFEFVKLTGCDFLAISIGTSHGAFKFKANPKLDITRLKKIKKLVKIPLVLHGASTVPEDILAEAIKLGACLSKAKGNDPNEIKKAVKNGINKVNIDTDLRIAFDKGVRDVIMKQCDVYDPRKILGSAKEVIKDVVKRKMKLLGSAGKA